MCSSSTGGAIGGNGGGTDGGVEIVGFTGLAGPKGLEADTAGAAGGIIVGATTGSAGAGPKGFEDETCGGAAGADILDRSGGVTGECLSVLDPEESVEEEEDGAAVVEEEERKEGLEIDFGRSCDSTEGGLRKVHQYHREVTYMRLSASGERIWRRRAIWTHRLRRRRRSSSSEGIRRRH